MNGILCQILKLSKKNGNRSAVITNLTAFFFLKDECSFVSLRDVERALRVMAWFYQHRQQIFPRMDQLAYETQSDETVGILIRHDWWYIKQIIISLKSWKNEIYRYAISRYTVLYLIYMYVCMYMQVL